MKDGIILRQHTINECKQKESLKILVQSTHRSIHK